MCLSDQNKLCGGGGRVKAGKGGQQTGEWPPTASVNCLSCRIPYQSGKKKQHKHKLFGPDFLRTFLTLTPECPGVKSFSPSPGPQENALFGADVHDFRRGRP